MAEHLEAVLGDSRLATRLVQHGLRTIRERHTCAHRVDELLGIAATLGIETAAAEAAEEKA
jgi:spore maturation protein CgeB